MRRDEEAAGLPELSFASFRKGGFTEFGDAEATDQEVLAQGGHRTCQMLTVYSKGIFFRTASAVVNSQAILNNLAPPVPRGFLYRASGAVT